MANFRQCIQNSTALRADNRNIIEFIYILTRVVYIDYQTGATVKLKITIFKIGRKKTILTFYSMVFRLHFESVSRYSSTTILRNNNKPNENEKKIGGILEELIDL